MTSSICAFDTNRPWRMPEQLAVDYAVQCCDKLVNSDDKQVASTACQMLLNMIKWRPMVIAELGALEFVGTAIQEKWRGSLFAKDVRKLTSYFAEGPEEALQIAEVVNIERLDQKAVSVVHGWVVRTRWKRIKNAVAVLQRVCRERRLNNLFAAAQAGAREYIERLGADTQRLHRVTHMNKRRQEFEVVEAADLSAFIVDQQENAVRLIQRWYRGGCGRKRVRALKEAAVARAEAAKVDAATVLQKYVRGWLVRKQQSSFGMLMLPIYRKITDTARIELQRQIDLRREMTKKAAIPHDKVEEVHKQAHELLRAHGRRRPAAAAASQKQMVLVQDLARFQKMFRDAPLLSEGSEAAVARFKQDSASIKHQAMEEHRRDMKACREAFWHPLAAANTAAPTIPDLLFNDKLSRAVGAECRLWLRKLFVDHSGDADRVWKAVHTEIPTFATLYTKHNGNTELALEEGLHLRDSGGSGGGSGAGAAQLSGADGENAMDPEARLEALHDISELASAAGCPEGVGRFLPMHALPATTTNASPPPPRAVSSRMESLMH